MIETARKPAQRWPVAKVGELAPGGCKLVTVKRYSIGLFNVNGEYKAALNLCPHELAPLCKGRVSGTTLPSKPGEFIWGREGEILSCPWHGWEFDLLTGAMLADERVRVRMYPVEVDGDDICIVL
jgi:3-phenylpropionate/trans-cinnamate dioxygenase ferredoxin subunit